MYESEALGGKVTIRTLTPSPCWGAIKIVIGKGHRSGCGYACTHVYTCHVCMHVRAHTHEVQSQQATVSLLWEWETSPSHSLVPGGNGSEHLANQLQLSPPSLKVSPPTGMIYSQVESENRSLSLCFSSSQAGWLAWGSRPRRESETKIMIYKANLDFTFHLCAISKAVEAAARLR